VIRRGRENRDRRPCRRSLEHDLAQLSKVQCLETEQGGEERCCAHGKVDNLQARVVGIRRRNRRTAALDSGSIIADAAERS
jgi:hypothetical protein